MKFYTIDSSLSKEEVELAARTLNCLLLSLSLATDYTGFVGRDILEAGNMKQYFYLLGCNHHLIDGNLPSIKVNKNNIYWSLGSLSSFNLKDARDLLNLNFNKIKSAYKPTKIIKLLIKCFQYQHDGSMDIINALKVKDFMRNSKNTNAINQFLLSFTAAQSLYLVKTYDHDDPTWSRNNHNEYEEKYQKYKNVFDGFISFMKDQPIYIRQIIFGSVAFWWRNRNRNKIWIKYLQDNLDEARKELCNYNYIPQPKLDELKIKFKKQEYIDLHPEIAPFQ